MTASAEGPSYGPYELLAKISDGPRGPAFVARLRSESGAEPRYVVELHAFATGEDEPQRAFHHDLARAARLRHKQVVRVVETGTAPAGDYVVVEYVEGATLSELQERHRAIRPPRLVLATVIDALHGLHAAHTLRVEGAASSAGDPALVHGSVSPDALVIGLDGTCRVTGFGNVRPRVQTRSSHRTQTAIGYLAPEQLTGAPVDPRADVFSIGVVLWNALTGKKLFHDRIEHMTMSNVLARKVPRPSSIGLSPPQVLDATVLKALERDPDRRFQDADELAQALRDVARGAACLAATSEVSEWITTTFGSELAARRRTIRELAQSPRRAAEVSVLARVAGPAAAEPTARDELSLDELARATDPPPRSGAMPPAGGDGDAPGVAPEAAPRRPARAPLALVGFAAFAVVALVLGWRWSVAAAAAGSDPPAAGSVALEVTVLDVRSAAAETARPAAVAESGAANPSAPMGGDPIEPTATASTASLDRAPPSPAVTVAPTRTPTRRRLPRASAPSRAASTGDRPEPAEPRPTEPRPELPPTPPPARPTLEANPYLYK